jgi:hypothetical protein
MGRLRLTITKKTTMQKLIKARLLQVPSHLVYKVGQEMDLVVSPENYELGKVAKSGLGFTFEVVKLKGDHIEPAFTEEEKEAYEAHKSRHIAISHRNGVE